MRIKTIIILLILLSPLICSAGPWDYGRSLDLDHVETDTLIADTAHIADLDFDMGTADTLLVGLFGISYTNADSIDVVSNTLTPTKSFIFVDGEAATDTVDTIATTGFTNGDYIMLQLANGNYDIMFTDGAPSNLRLVQNRWLTSTQDQLVLQKRGNSWYEAYFANNHDTWDAKDNIVIKTFHDNLWAAFLKIMASSPSFSMWDSDVNLDITTPDSSAIVDEADGEPSRTYYSTTGDNWSVTISGDTAVFKNAARYDIDNDVVLPQTKKVILDNDEDSYIVCSGDDVLEYWVGGVKIWDATATEIDLNVTQKFNQIVYDESTTDEGQVLVAYPMNLATDDTTYFVPYAPDGVNSYMVTVEGDGANGIDKLTHYFLGSDGSVIATMKGYDGTNTVSFTALTNVDSIFTNSGATTYIDVLSLADAGEHAFADGVAGSGRIIAGDNEAHAWFTFTSAGVVTLDLDVNCTTTDNNDGTLNIFDNGDGITIENQLGDTKTISIDILYHTP